MMRALAVDRGDLVVVGIEAAGEAEDIAVAAVDGKAILRTTTCTDILFSWQFGVWVWAVKGPGNGSRMFGQIWEFHCNTTVACFHVGQS